MSDTARQSDIYHQIASRLEPEPKCSPGYGYLSEGEAWVGSHGDWIPTLSTPSIRFLAKVSELFPDYVIRLQRGRLSAVSRDKCRGWDQLSQGSPDLNLELMVQWLLDGEEKE